MLVELSEMIASETIDLLSPVEVTKVDNLSRANEKFVVTRDQLFAPCKPMHYQPAR